MLGISSAFILSVTKNSFFFHLDSICPKIREDLLYQSLPQPIPIWSSNRPEKNQIAQTLRKAPQIAISLVQAPIEVRTELVII